MEVAHASAALPLAAVSTSSAQLSRRGSTVNAKGLAKDCSGAHAHPRGQVPRFEPAPQCAKARVQNLPTEMSV